MLRSESPIPFFEFTPDGLELNHIKTEPEVPTENEVHKKDCFCSDEKYQLQEEEVDILDEKCDVLDRDHEEELVKEECNSEHMQYEPISNRHVRIKITDTENIKNITEEKDSSAFNKTSTENDEVLKCANKITLEGTECATNVQQQEIHHICPHCGIEVHSEAALTKHTSEEHSRKKSERKNNQRIDELQMVTRNKTLAEPRKSWKCTLCPYVAKRPTHIRKHFKQVHSEIRSFQCPYCEYAAKVKNSLKSHLLSRHGDKCETEKTKYICYLCEKEFGKKSSLKKHIDKVHLNLRRKCPECKYDGRSDYELKSHILLVHHPENLFRCYDCGYFTPFKEKLRSHILGVHIKYDRYTCDICEDYKTNHSSKLRAHKLTHKYPNKIFKCPHCSYSANNKTVLNVHVRGQHTKEYIFTCPHCEYKTNLLPLLNEHVNVKHNKSDFFVCSECGKYRSKYLRNVRFHMAKSHGINTNPRGKRKPKNQSLKPNKSNKNETLDNKNKENMEDNEAESSEL